MADIFLSYSSTDRRAAGRLVEAFGASGHSVFWDQQTPSGVDWDVWIRGKLADSRVVVVLWSRNAARSDNVRHEAILAREAGKLVPAMIEEMEPGDFPMGFYMVQGAKLQHWDGDAAAPEFSQLLDEIDSRAAAAGDARPPRPKLKRRPMLRAWPFVAGGLALVALVGAVLAISRMQPPPAGAPSREVASQTTSGGLDAVGWGGDVGPRETRTQPPAGGAADGAKTTASERTADTEVPERVRRAYTQAFDTFPRLAVLYNAAKPRIDATADREAVRAAVAQWSRGIARAERDAGQEQDLEEWRRRNPSPTGSEREQRQEAFAYARTKSQRRSRLSQNLGNMQARLAAIPSGGSPENCASEIERATIAARGYFDAAREFGSVGAFNPPRRDPAALCTPPFFRPEDSAKYALASICAAADARVTARECEQRIQHALAEPAPPVPLTDLTPPPPLLIGPLTPWLPSPEFDWAHAPKWAFELRRSDPERNKFSLTSGGGAFWGAMSRGRRDGCGLELLPDGALLQGCFVADRLDGAAIIVAPSRGYFRGFWLDGALVRRVPMDLRLPLAER